VLEHIHYDGDVPQGIAGRDAEPPPSRARPRRAGRGAVLLAVLALVPATGALRSAAPSPARPRLVLFVSVDQFRFDYLDRFASLYQGGLHRLRTSGAVFANARYRHSSTETGPGHAVLLSGRHGRDTGIVANDWYDRLSGEVNVVDDAASRPLPGPGRAASPVNFLGVTVGDLLKRSSPESRVVGVGLKDRAAVLMAGRRADAAYWYEPDAGRFGSSTYYMRALPDWLLAWNAEGHVDRLQGRTWTRLLADPGLYEETAGPDDVAGEWDGKDTVFPHRIRGTPPSREFYLDLRRTPYADELTLDVALRAMDAHELGRDEATDLLAVGFAASDAIGHTYGADSQEVMDEYLRLDRVLGRLFEAAEARAGRDGVLLGLSSDHGALPLVELLRGRGLDARRLPPSALDEPLHRALRERYPQAGALIAHDETPNYYLDLDALRRHGLARAEVEGVAARAMMATGLVERVYTHAQLLGDPPADDPDFALFRNAFFEPRSPHLIGRLKPYIYMEDNYTGGSGHGTVHDYDRHVPVAFAGHGIRAGRYESACGPHDIAPTLAALLGLPYRLDEGQRVLKEALAAAERPGEGP
jgi:predicted AlkP superfamily pyrophosphatase or phosphodiesterase